MVSRGGATAISYVLSCFSQNTPFFHLSRLEISDLRLDYLVRSSPYRYQVISYLGVVYSCFRARVIFFSKFALEGDEYFVLRYPVPSYFYKEEYMLLLLILTVTF